MKLLKNTYHHITAPSDYRTGLKLYQNKQWQNARQFFQTAVKESARHPGSHFKLGLCNMKLGNLEEAHYYLSQAVALAPYNTQWHTQLEQCIRKLNHSSHNTSYLHTKDQQPPAPVKRIRQGGFSQTLGIRLKKRLLLIPSDYNRRVMADILPFIKFYKDQFDIYIILRDLEEDIISEGTHTLIKNGTSYGEFLKFTADYVIDAGTMNFGYRITDAAKWVSVWHGIPYKKMFVDFDIQHLPNAIRYNLAYDCMISMSDFYTQTFLRGAMHYEGEILQIGCAKADKMFGTEIEENSSPMHIKMLLGLPLDKKIALYAPQLRSEEEAFTLPFSPERLLEELGEEYCLLVAADKQHSLSENPGNLNIHYTRNLQQDQALIIASVLISDYRHCLIRLFRQYGKPVILFQYDYEHYLKLHPDKKTEIESLAAHSHVATRESRLYSFDWQQIKAKAEQACLPENFKPDLKKTLNIPEGKKVILYAPTFRKAGGMVLPFDADKLAEHLNNEYVIITKLHYLNHLEHKYEHVIDCTAYSELADLMKIADILISDYSSLILDFALLGKPIVLFQYDYHQYMQQRGAYFDFEQYLPAEHIIDREMDLYLLDWNRLQSNNDKLVQTFYPLEDGHSTERIVNALSFDASSRQSKDIIFLVNALNQIGGVHSFLKNMAKYYKTRYNTRIYVLAIKEFAETNSEYHLLDSPHVDFKLSSQYLNGACANILQNTDGIVISLQFSAHMHFQKHLTEAKTILMFHGDIKDMISRDMYGPHLGWLNDGHLYNYQKLLLLTQSSVDLLSAHVNEAVRSKLGFMHNSIDAEYRPLVQTGLKRTAVISRLDADKNILSLIDLGKHIRDTGEKIEINIYGDGALKAELSAAVQGNGLQNILKIRGFESDKTKIFAENDSLLLPSKSEGFPLVVLEAYAHGRPVIAFDSFTAAKEIILHGQTGFLLPYGDYQAVIGAIDQCHTIAAENIRQCFEQFSNQNIFAQWDSLFAELDQQQSLSENEWK